MHENEYISTEGRGARPPSPLPWIRQYFFKLGYFWFISNVTPASFLFTYLAPFLVPLWHGEGSAAVTDPPATVRACAPVTVRELSLEAQPAEP